MTAKDFIQLHGAKEFRHSMELLPGIASGECSLHKSESPGKQPCRHFLRIYSIRSGHLRKFTTPHAISIREDFEALCKELGTNPDEPCRLWIFISSSYDFTVFEGTTTQRILGCIRGVDRRKVDEATWAQLWGNDNES